MSNMKITGLRPLIVSQDAEKIKDVFEELGFECRHTKADIDGGKNTNFNLKDAEGHVINVASSKTVPQDVTSISINVDNFDEAYDYFISKGFVNPRGDQVSETESAISTLLFSPSGFAITISEHKKDR